MNVILILIDSLNRRMLDSYGSTDVQTPNLSAFADRGVRFTGHYVGSLPCMPARREIFSGRQDLMWRGWGPLEPFDAPLPRLAAQHGATTMMVTDHYHYWEQGAHGYIESFQGAELIRGHELDYWKTQPADTPEWVRAINKWRPGWGDRYYRNVAAFKDERDFFSPRVMRAAADWLDGNHSLPQFFLQIESFDVHEPFHVPEPYRSLYTDDLNPAYTCWPPYQNPAVRERFFNETSEAELNYIRAQYKGKVTMMDRWLGEVWAAMDRHNLWSNTAVIITTDHGHDLGERRAFGKQYPHHDSHANIPLMMWHPEFACSKGEVNALTSTVDLYSTILETLGARDFNPVHSRSILPLLDGRAASIREACLYGTFGTGACCTDGEYVFIHGCQPDKPLFAYTALMPHAAPDATAGKFIPGVDCPVWRIPFGVPAAAPSYLMKRGADPGDLHDLSGAEPQTADRMKSLLKQCIDATTAPPEQYDRLDL